jgi:hypothetical protein
VPDLATPSPSPAPTSLWERIKALVHRYLDIVPKVVDNLCGAAKEMDNVTPSSARTYGGLIFLAALVLQVMIV